MTLKRQRLTLMAWVCFKPRDGDAMELSFISPMLPNFLPRLTWDGVAAPWLAIFVEFCGLVAWSMRRLACESVVL